MTTASSGVNDNHDNEELDYVEMTLPVQILTATGLAILITFAISGNVMTITAYIKSKSNRRVYDFYIFNLAITDLLISSISMPFYAVYTLMDFTWPFGYAFCKAWLISDFTCCFQSMLLMLLLSLDRLLLLILGPYYSVRMTMKIAKVQILISWVISFMVYGPSIIGWNHWMGYSTVEDKDCDVEFAYDFDFTACTAVIEFVLPFIFLSSMNAVIFWKIRKRKRISPTLPPVSQMASIDVRPAGILPHSNMEQLTGLSSVPSSSTCQEPKLQNGTTHALRNSFSRTSRIRRPTQQIAQQTLNQIEAKHEMKAASFLSILVMAFLLLWAPYTVTTMAIAFCGDRCLNLSLYEFFTWVLWVKSAINPLLYALNSSFYRRQFIRYLSCNGMCNACHSPSL